LFALNEVNITQAIIDAYDAEHAGAPAAGAPTPGAGGE
jgi:hypothetical protein